MRVKYTITIEDEQDPAVWEVEERELCSRIKQVYDEGGCDLGELVNWAKTITLQVEPA